MVEHDLRNDAEGDLLRFFSQNGFSRGDGVEGRPTIVEPTVTLRMRLSLSFIDAVTAVTCSERS